MTCRSAQGAQRASKAFEAAFANFQTFVERSLREQGAPPGSFVFEILSRLAAATGFEVQETTVLAQTPVDLKIDTDILPQQIAQAQQAARRNATQNKMKRLAIALHNYHDAYRRLPPAVLIGPDGKTPHSWRVALLPFLEKNDLYKRYRKDEPWDSEHNKKLISEASELFSAETDPPHNGCGFFLLTGPGTVFDPAQAPAKFVDIIDGLSKTIAIVEAKRSIPWTKPEDIEYDPAKPVPKLGGSFPGGFLTAFMDGSVRLLPEDLDEKTLRALITRDGREVIELDQKTRRLKVVE